jgi:hypothetical protein
VVIIKAVIMQAFEVVGKRDVIGNLYITDLLRNYPPLAITYKIILRSLRLLSWFLFQSRIAVFFGMKKGFARLA